MEQLNDDDLIKTIKYSNNVETKKNEEIETLEICMEKSINLNVFENFINIKYLFLIKNNITDVTPLFNCVKLKVLFLQLNSIKRINKLTKLEKLNLFNNQLTEEFINIQENRNLTYIDLSDNNIKNVDFFINTYSLVHINLANNNIKNIDALRNNLNLEYLNLSGNRINKFEDIQILHRLHNLKEFYLSSIYYKNNVLILDHEKIIKKYRNITIRHMNVLRNIIDFKINYIKEKYNKEKQYILFINNKNVSYINEVLKPLHFFYNLEDFYSPNEAFNKENDTISKIKEEIDYLLGAYISRFDYIIKRLKHEKELQIKYLTTSMNSYYNIFFEMIDKKHEDYQKIEDLIKFHFIPETLKNYFTENIKIDNIIKVKKLSDRNLDTLIEQHLKSLVYEKKLLFLHPYNYCKINNFYEFDEAEQTVEDPKKRKFFDKNYVCSSYNINHILKTLINIFLEEDLENDIVHLIYSKKKKQEDFSNIETDINIKKKIVKSKKIDLMLFPIYIVESYFFPGCFKEVNAHSVYEENPTEIKKYDTTEDKNIDEHINEQRINSQPIENMKDIKFKLYYTLPVHTNLKYIVNFTLTNSTNVTKTGSTNSTNSNLTDSCSHTNTESHIVNSNSNNNNSNNNINSCYNKKKSNEKNGTMIKTQCSMLNIIKNKKQINYDFFNYMIQNKNTSNDNDNNNITNLTLNEKIKNDFINFVLNFDYINFFRITKYFIKLSKLICEIKKNILILLQKKNLKCLKQNDNINNKEQVKILSYDDLQNVEKKKKEALKNVLIISPSDNLFLGENKFNIIENGDSGKNGQNRHQLYLNNLLIGKLNLLIFKENLTNIKELHLKNNNINNLSTFFQGIENFDLINLEYLDLSFNCIYDISPIYNKFKNLIFFNISFNFLYDYKHIIRFSLNHKKLEHLNILCNSIYITFIQFSNIYLFYPNIKTFNQKKVIIKNSAFVLLPYLLFPVCSEKTEMDNVQLVVDDHGQYKHAEESLKNQTKINKEINLNYIQHVKKINLSGVYYQEIGNLNFSKFTNLIILDLSNNALVNLNNIKLPNSLKVLNIKNNNLTDINFLKNNLSIETLILDKNDIDDINIINFIPNLKIIRCSHNKLHNLPLLHNLHLTEINIHNNLIKDITPLVLIKNKTLIIAINIYNNKINFPNLELYIIHLFPNLLILNNNYVEKKTNLDKIFKNVYTLDVFFDIYNMYPPYTSLKSLEIKNLKIKNILFNINNDHFKNLQYLNISNNYINNIKNVGPLDNLKVLILNNNKHISEDAFIGDNNVNVLNSFKSLEELDVSYCIISKTIFFKNILNLQNFKILNLEGNIITSIKYLNTLKNLQVLNLSNNKISKIFSDSFPSNLENLNLSNNLIRNLCPLDKMQKLQTLDLRVNRIDNIDEFKHLTSLNSLKNLNLNGNRKIKEHFEIIKSMLNQVECFDNKNVKEQDTTAQQTENKKENINPTYNQYNNKKNIVNDLQENNTSKNITQAKLKNVLIKPKPVVKTVNRVVQKINLDEFIIVGKKADSNKKN
ncbi:leucine-rich repeat protein [Hepatocystis sp. ex Piliocolobus tephrosceles]|nr:leucine-rich repeat protein [Hepatocystis sp. ex Piliocolobus tephrosceles]